ARFVLSFWPYVIQLRETQIPARLTSIRQSTGSAPGFCERSTRFLYCGADVGTNTVARLPGPGAGAGSRAKLAGGRYPYAAMRVSRACSSSQKALSSPEFGGNARNFSAVEMPVRGSVTLLMISVE